MKSSLLAIIIVHILLYLAIAFNVPVLRQTIAFIYLTFVPGFILLRFLKLKELHYIEVFLFSVGLSLAFLMFAGLLISSLLYVVGISHPLSIIPLLFTLGPLTLILTFFGYRKDQHENTTTLHSLQLSEMDIIKGAILFLPLIFGFIGAMFVSVSSISTPFLTLMIISITVLFATIGFSTKLLPSKLYPLAIFAIILALILHILFTSNYIIGSDSQLEFHVFKYTLANGYWHFISLGNIPLQTANFNSMLSITILPSIYSLLLNINGELLFKTLYAFVLALIPVVLYRLYLQHVGKPTAILSALFLLSSPLVFYSVESLSLNRQVVAELFFVLSVFVLLSNENKISILKQRLLLIVFCAAIIASHYTIAFIYLGYVCFVFLSLRLTRNGVDKVLNGTMIFLFFIMTFTWYNFAVAPLNSLAQNIYNIFSKFSSNILSPAARSSSIFSSHTIETPASMVNWVLFYTVHALIVIGVIGLFIKCNASKFDPKFRNTALFSCAILVLSVAIPNFATSLNFSRFYAITILLLAPCFVLGGMLVIDFLNFMHKKFYKKIHNQLFIRNSKAKLVSILLCILIIGYFVSQSGFLNFVTDAAPLSTALDYTRFSNSNDTTLNIAYYGDYVVKTDVLSAVWLSAYVGNSLIYADYFSATHVLTSYGLIPRQQISYLYATPILSQAKGGFFIYLSQMNTMKGLVTVTNNGVTTFNSSDIPYLNESILIYSNGNSEIMYMPPRLTG